MKTSPLGYLELLQFPRKKLIHTNPPIYYIEKFLSHNECQHIINISDKNVRKSQVVDRITGQGVEHPSRTSESCYHEYNLKWLISRVTRLTGVPQEFQEPTQVARYTSGQFYECHQDAIDNPDAKGQRIGTVLIYLNNVESGGATYFNTLNVRVQPKEGDAIVFFPAKMDSIMDERYLHTAETAGSLKWVSQIWLRGSIC
jgi:Rps23 Pro-64 3,4-dihydroxylase Tpa1-like proline 4-hydroxylase